MTARDIIHLTVCVDCYMMSANGEAETAPEGFGDRYAAGCADLGDAGYGIPFPSSWPRDDGTEWPDDDVDRGIDRERFFSSSPCDLCGDGLAGDRYPAAVFLERVAERPHEWRTGRLTGATTCSRCGLLPLDAADAATECNPGERCPACGSPVDYCQGHGDIGDPYGAAILADHDDGRHARCHSLAGCQE